MTTVTVVYTGILVIEGEKIYLKDIAVKSDFASTSGSGNFLDCTTDYNTFSLGEGFEITFLENGDKTVGNLFFDKNMKQWFIYNKNKDLLIDIKTGLLVTYNLELPIVDSTEWEAVKDKGETKEIASVLKWLN